MEHELLNIAAKNFTVAQPISASSIILNYESEKKKSFQFRQFFIKVVSVATPLLLLGVWEILSNLKIIDVRFFPAPSAIFSKLWDLFQSGEIWDHLWASIGRTVYGYIWGVVPGVIIGIVMGISPIVRAAIQPLVDATFPIPKIAIFPLFLIIFGIGDGSKIAIIAVAVFYIVLINTVSGVANIPSIYIDVGQNYRASRWLFFRDIALPGALPFIFAGLKLAMGIALIVLVSAEFVGARSGLGYLVWSSWSVLLVEDMYAGLLIIAVLGLLSTYALNYIERVVIPWKR
ncbi:MAG: ABC transporter permease [Chloroflexi bacterium]|uniref:ABC transporter permease n=1 Tax=Candidatus Chlorohelix allophototropha TaxID=3003348 RepID=A0A8T7M457_9CHLR|nr:ABC transporter permease [Chloroflexota bacterium]WJW70150.1 ABC transporter permease [Chloroflexota bacterium L227-S17]